MKVILSPTKQMKPVERTPLQIPHFIKDSAIICEALKQLTAEELRRLMKINESLRRKQNSGMPSCPFPWKVRRLCLHITVCNSSICTPRIFLKRILHMRRNACVFFPVCMVYFSQWMPYSRIVWKCRHVCLLQGKRICIPTGETVWHSIC